MRRLKRTPVDSVVSHIAFIFGVYFDESIRLVLEEGYFENLLNFKSNKLETNRQFDEVKETALLYIRERVNI